MAIITSLLGRIPTDAEIKSKKKRIQNIINANSGIKGAVDQAVGARRPKTEKQLETARIKAIQKMMKTNTDISNMIAAAVTKR
jgi:hypothetical protein